jgi:cobalamin-dependent methionine synthase I
MAATLGSEAESLLRRAQSRSMGDALILDALGSAAIEAVCDQLCAEIAQELSPRRLTARFSPGYGDLPLDQQRELFAVLDVTRRIGVSLSESALMLPQKSVTALIGVRAPQSSYTTGREQP